MCFIIMGSRVSSASAPGTTCVSELESELQERGESNTIDGLDTEPASNPDTTPRNHPWWDNSNFYKLKRVEHGILVTDFMHLRYLFWAFNVACHSIIVIWWCLDRPLPSHTIHYNWVISSHHDHYLDLTIASHFWPPHTIQLTVPSASILIVVTTLYITLHYPNFTPSPANHWPFKLASNFVFYIDISFQINVNHHVLKSLVCSCPRTIPCPNYIATLLESTSHTFTFYFECREK